MSLDLIVKLLEVLAPVLLILGLGYGWARSGRPFDTALVTNLVINLGAPALVFHTLATVQIDPAAMTLMGVATLSALACFLALGAAGLHLARLSVRGYLPSLTFPNIGNMGLPICLFAFGEEGLAMAVVVFATVGVVQFTLGIWISSDEANWLGFLRSPLIYAVLSAVLVNLSGVGLPLWLDNTTGLLGQFTIPLMLLTLGVSLASMHVNDLGLSFTLGFVRVAMGGAVGLLLAGAFGFDGAARGVLVLQCAMPAAVFNFLLAQKYQRQARQVAGVVMASTAIAFVVFPVLIPYLWR